MNLEQQIKVAEKRIYDAECRRAEFAKKYNETGILLYERLAESETKTISEIRDEIIEASLYMN